MTREMSEDFTSGPSHFAFVAVLNALLAHTALLTGGLVRPSIARPKNEQPPALHLVPDEPTQIFGAGF